MRPGLEDPEKSGTFARAFVTVQYLLGRRNEELTLGLTPAPTSHLPAAASCATLVQQLKHADRNVRAMALASQVAVLARSLNERGLK